MVDSETLRLTNIAFEPSNNQAVKRAFIELDRGEFLVIKKIEFKPGLIGYEIALGGDTPKGKVVDFVWRTNPDAHESVVDGFLQVFASPGRLWWVNIKEYMDAHGSDIACINKPTTPSPTTAERQGETK